MILNESNVFLGKIHLLESVLYDTCHRSLSKKKATILFSICNYTTDTIRVLQNKLLIEMFEAVQSKSNYF